MQNGSIYSLVDPRNNVVRYIGQTTRENIESRLAEHIYQSRFNNHRTSTWIKSLKALSLKPIIKSLISVPVEKLDDCEAELINHFKQFCNLTNHKPGGNSRRGFKMSEETKRKISLANKGRIRMDCRVKRSDEFKEAVKKSGVYERARARMLSDKNPGKNRIRTKFYVPVSEYEKLRKRKLKSESFKINNPAFKSRKAILQFTLDGAFVKEWISAAEIKKTLNIDTKGIRNCCKGHKSYKQSQGFVWKYKSLNSN